MKRILAGIAVLVLLLAGCGKQEAASGQTELPTVTTEPTAAPFTHVQAYCPWEYDVVQQAISDGGMHFYFMAGDGLEEADTKTTWGESCLAVMPDGTTVLIDCGAKVYGPVLLQNLQRMGVKKIDHLVITGGFPEHQDGIFAQENLERFLGAVQVGQVYWNGVTDPKREASVLVQTVCAQRDLPLRTLQQGDQLNFGPVSVDVLWPKAGTDQVSGIAALKNNAMVLKFSLDVFNFLFVGDLYEEGGAQMVSANLPMLENIEAMKLANHGDADANSSNVLNSVLAVYAVSMGYEKPADQLLERLENYGYQLYSDYENGYIHIATDGMAVEIENFRGPAES